MSDRVRKLLASLRMLRAERRDLVQREFCEHSCGQDLRDPEAVCDCLWRAQTDNAGQIVLVERGLALLGRPVKKRRPATFAGQGQG